MILRRTLLVTASAALAVGAIPSIGSAERDALLPLISEWRAEWARLKAANDPLSLPADLGRLDELEHLIAATPPRTLAGAVGALEMASTELELGLAGGNVDAQQRALALINGALQVLRRQ